MKLDENERGNTTRLMKVKDMMLEAQMHERHEEDDEAEAEETGNTEKTGEAPSDPA